MPTGNVTLDWFTNNTCEGNPASTSGNFPLVNGSVDAVGFAKGPLSAGLYGFRAHYLGSATYGSSDGACEPLRVVDANIQITPPDATNRINQNHVFTAHVNVNDGTGQVNAPIGTTINFTTNGAPSGSCTTSDAYGLLLDHADLGDDGRLGRAGFGDGLGRRPHADALDRRRRAELRPRDEALGQRAHLDHADGDERGRPSAHVHRHAAEGHRRRQRLRPAPPASTSPSR